MKKFLLSSVMMCAGFAVQKAEAACTVYATATQGTVTLQCAGGTSNRSGLAWNPTFSLYYSVNAGSSSYPVETFNSSGTQVNTVAQGFDYRGLWWNPNTSALEGNGYGSSGVCTHTLNGSGYATGAVTTLFTGTAQPSSQSCGTYDAAADEIVHYANGSLYRYSHSSGNFLGTVAISGLPVAFNNIDSTSPGYTGCAGMEICIYDFVNKAVYFINKSTGAYVATSQLPISASNPDRFRFSFCNGMAWVYDAGTSQWISYLVADLQTSVNPVAENNVSVEVFPNPFSTTANVVIHADYFTPSAASFVLYDLLGNAVMNETVSSGNFTISRNGLAPGIYVYRITNEGEELNKGRILIE